MKVAIFKDMIMDFDFEITDLSKLEFKAWFQVAEDVYINVDMTKERVYTSDACDEYQRDLEKTEKYEWLAYAHNFFIEAYRDTILEYEEEYENWLKDSKADD